MNANNEHRVALQRIASRLNTAEQALRDVRTLLTDIYESEVMESRPVPQPQPAPKPVVAPPVTVTPAPPKFPRPMVTAAKAEPWWKDESAVIKAVAVGGVLITLAGIALLVALAIQHGILGPIGRVVGAWLLTAIFAAGAFFVHSKGWSRAGRNALAITSLVGSQITAFPTASLLHWNITAVSLIVMTLAAIFAGVGRTWRDQPLLIIVSVVSCLILVPEWLADPDKTVPPTMPFVLLLVASMGLGMASARVWASIAVLVTFLLSSGVPKDIQRTIVNDPPLTAAFIATIFFSIPLLDKSVSDRKVQRWAGIVTPLATLGIGLLVREKPYASLIVLALVLTFLVAGYILKERAIVAVMLCAFPITYLAHWQVSPAFGSDALFIRPLFVVLFFLIAAGVAWWLADHNTFTAWPWVFWLVSAAIITWELGRSVLAKSPLWLTDVHAAVQALAIAVFLVVIYLRRQALAGFGGEARALFGIGGLHLSALVIVTLTTFLLEKAGGNEGMWLGYLIGHALVSISWMLIAAYILVWSKSLSDSASLKVGLIMALAATVKLVFFDLGTLEGVPRVIAFLISGIALLTIASLRSRRARP
ncbi:DUF2339 domain-containing protein [Staphylococcus chromogenes]|nr:DUF2339 domain-containing protein [Staphylococcus chromogenes]